MARNQKGAEEIKTPLWSSKSMAALSEILPKHLVMRGVSLNTPAILAS